MSIISWDREFQARFRRLADDEIEAWDSIIQDEIRNCTEDELRNAVKHLGEQKRKGEFKYAPTVEDLKSAIIHNRWMLKKEQSVFLPTESCVLCRGTGWIEYIVCVDSQTGEKHFGVEKHKTLGFPQYDECTPCLCTRGEKILKIHYKESDFEKMIDWSRKVSEWRKSVKFSEHPEESYLSV
jgi:hypothetical protein